MGWGKRTGLRARLFGNVIDSVLWAAHCPVAVTRLLNSPNQIQRILVPLENVTMQALSAVRFAHMLAAATEAQVTVLHVCNRRVSAARITWTQAQLSLLVAKLALPNQLDIQVTPHDNVSQAILEAARSYDLVVLRSIRRSTSTGGLVIGDVTAQLVATLPCSIVMLGEPQPASTEFLESSQRETTGTIKRH